MKRLTHFLILAVITTVSMAQSYVETFDANSLDWTESSGESTSGSAIIDKGVMTIKSKGDTKLTRFVANANGDSKGFENTAFETHCYAPLDVHKPFEVIANVKLDNLSLDRKCGLIFNYRDFGNYYAFVFNKDAVSFLRFADNRCVGSITQDIKWPKAEKGKQYQVWKLVSEDEELRFFINGLLLFKVKYMPLDFTGIGFYTIGNQTLVVDDVTFTQNVTNAGMQYTGELTEDSSMDENFFTDASYDDSVSSNKKVKASKPHQNEAKKEHLTLIFKKKRKNSSAWVVQNTKSLFITYEKANTMAEEWNNKTNDSFDYKCNIKKEDK